MAGRNFSLTEHLSSFVDDQVTCGRHQNASEVVREALRRYEDDIVAELANLALLEKVANAGIEAITRGDYVTVENEDQHQALMDDFLERAIQRAAARRAPRG
ncbi:MAG: type II toxin-antitoxin system ParD family antitoxin [Azospirillaceae bacterium]|nr:type II toxin-antitoxin system ParD family antitoxin [Azospirillaceae bacterium]